MKLFVGTDRHDDSQALAAERVEAERWSICATATVAARPGDTVVPPLAPFSGKRRTTGM
jgi:hypothetical protein